MGDGFLYIWVYFFVVFGWCLVGVCGVWLGFVVFGWGLWCLVGVCGVWLGFVVFEVVNDGDGNV